MTLDDYKSTLSFPVPPGGVQGPLKALWLDAKGNWDEAHRLVQELPDRNAAWVHAYLHREEGDLGNASYWYHRAGKTVAGGDLETEWEKIARALLRELTGR